jgi:hypothetical protein
VRSGTADVNRLYDFRYSRLPCSASVSTLFGCCSRSSPPLILTWIPAS